MCLFIQTLPRSAHTPNAPHTPHTPGSVAGLGLAHVPKTEPASGNDRLAQLDLTSDLNFDPAAVIDGGGEGQESLNVRFFSLKICLILLSFCDGN